MADAKPQSNVKSSGASGGASDGLEVKKGNSQQGQPIDLDQFIDILYKLKQIQRPSSIAPSNIPKNFINQIQLYDNGSGTTRLYLYISGTWRYVTLT